jgi:Rrf2 family protein
MLISRTSQYAIQSLIYIATQKKTEPILSRDIAERIQVPAPYLAKIMQDLSKAGLLTSFRGRLGGFCLSEEPKNIDLMRILYVTEGPEFSKKCVLGLKICSKETACVMHHKWQPITDELSCLFKQQNLATLSEAVIVGKYRISDMPQVLMS